MNLPPYSSLTAFIAHFQALRTLKSPAPQQAALLAEMESIIGELGASERESLKTSATSGQALRHRQRAERHLTQILRSRGVLSG